jgi:hypothetical protein
VATDDPDNEPVAPVPPHERTWRHPSEVAKERRTIATVAPPPLSQLVTGIAACVAVVLCVTLVGLALPRTADRDTTPRNAAPTLTTAEMPSDAPATSMAFADRGGESYFIPIDIFLAAFDTTSGGPSAASLFVSVGSDRKPDSTAMIATAAGSQIPLKVAFHDSGLNLVLLRSDVPVAIPSVPSAFASVTRNSIGSTMILHGQRSHRTKIGLSTGTMSSRSFIPFEDDGDMRDVPRAALVTDAAGRLAGLFSRHNDSVGLVPVSAIVEFVERALQSLQ